MAALSGDNLKLPPRFSYQSHFGKVPWVPPGYAGVIGGTFQANEMCTDFLELKMRLYIKPRCTGERENGMCTANGAGENP